MTTKKMQSTESVLALLFSTNTQCSVLLSSVKVGETISEKNQHGITFTMCLGKTSSFDVVGDP